MKGRGATIDSTVVNTLHQILAFAKSHDGLRRAGTQQAKQGEAAPTGENEIRSYNLTSNYPNPFNPVTSISYDIPENSIVTLAVYDVLGRQVATLVNETVSAGRHDAVFDASGMPSGVYFYRIEATSSSDPIRSFAQVRKMVVLK